MYSSEVLYANFIFLFKELEKSTPFFFNYIICIANINFGFKVQTGREEIRINSIRKNEDE